MTVQVLPDLRNFKFSNFRLMRFKKKISKLKNFKTRADFFLEGNESAMSPRRRKNTAGR